MTRRIGLLLVLCLLLAGCNLPQVTTPQAWIDAPLDGSILPLAPCEVVFHAYAAGNPAAVELTINGAIVSLVPPPLDQPLVTVRYLWNPEGSGRYVIAARTQDSTNSWSEPHTHVVIIEEMALVPTITITSTSAPTPTVTVTPSLTLTPTATLRAGSVFSNLRISSNIFYRLDATPTKVTFTINVNDPAGIGAVEFYFRLRDPDTDETTEWANEPMSALGGGDYTYTLNRAHPALTPTSRIMTLEYQIIVTHPDYSLTRSQVYSDVTLKDH